LTGFRNTAAVDGPRKRVAVIGTPHPTAERLLSLLEQVFPVCFAQGDRADAALVLDPDRLPEVPAHLPRLLLAARTRDLGSATTVALADDGRLARPLRGRTIADSAGRGELAPPRPGVDRVLASVDRRPAWWQAGKSPEAGGGPEIGGGPEAASPRPDGDTAGLWCSAHPLAELGEGETLRDHLRAGRFMGLLPLLHFLGEVLGAEGWTLPAPRASFVVDDPNLHWPSYGHLAYRELIAHAQRHGYHMGFATVPLDRWWVDPRAARLVRENGSALSLLMHGNNHSTHELGRLRGDREAESAMAQALRRIAALERSARVGIERVMVPPHSRCSEEALRAMFRLGIEGVCLNRSYPWRDAETPITPLGEWYPAELVAGGMPMLLRSPLVDPRDDLPFRALLGQPLILYGHHWDFADGLDILAEAARDIDSLGEVRWGPLGPVARESYATRRVGETLFVRMHARAVSIEVPAGVRELRVLAPEPLGGAGWRQLAHGGAVAEMAFADGVGFSEPLLLDEGLRAPESLPSDARGRIELKLIPDRPLDPTAVPAPRPRPWPLIRRAMVEGRDRVQGLR
jgi:hypothetical protein